MRKTVISPDTINQRPPSQEEWLDLEEIVTVEVTSEDPNFPIESALSRGKAPAGGRPNRVNRSSASSWINPRPLRRIRLEFSETDVERTQEFALRWSQTGGPFRELVRQQWNFSPQGSTSEVEDYRVQLEKSRSWS